VAASRADTTAFITKALLGGTCNSGAGAGCFVTDIVVDDTTWRDSGLIRHALAIVTLSNGQSVQARVSCEQSNGKLSSQNAKWQAIVA
jgi:hypothetical protein